MAENRLLLVSPFAGSVHRAHPQPALRGQRPTVLIAHAQPGGKTEQLAGELLAGGRQVYTLDHPGNRNLLAMGAQVYT